MLSNKKLSIVTISIIIFSAFATVPLLLALQPGPGFDEPKITVNPSSVNPGQMVTIMGSNFNPLSMIKIQLYTADIYDHLGSVVANSEGRFSFSFRMQDGYPGNHTVYADGGGIENDAIAVIELQYTNPIDQRLVDLIISHKNEQIDAGGGSYEFKNSEGMHVIYPSVPYYVPPAKMTITIATNGFDPDNEDLYIIYSVGSNSLLETQQTITSDTDILPQTYEFCFSRQSAIKLEGDGEFQVYYSYVVEYEP